MSFKHTPERMRHLVENHPAFVKSLENKMPLVLQDKTEVYSFLTDDNVLYHVHLTYVYACKQRHDIESMVEGKNYMVTGLYWIPDAVCNPIEVDDYEELTHRCNEFMEIKFDIEDCYTKYDFGYEDEEEEELAYGNKQSDNPNPVDHEGGHYL